MGIVMGESRAYVRAFWRLRALNAVYISLVINTKTPHILAFISSKQTDLTWYGGVWESVWVMERAVAV